MQKLFVIKVGGNIIDDEQKLHRFCKDFSSVPAPKILVHGGGKIATKIGEQLGLKSEYINGRRVTDASTIDLVTMVYGGLVNKKIVSLLQSLGCNAIGLTGADGNIIPATKRPVTKEGIDFGFVGDPDQQHIGSGSLKALLNEGFIPIMAPLSHDTKGQFLNTNADTIASSLAIALSAHFDVRLIYCFEKKGVLLEVTDDNSVIPLITKEIYSGLMQEKKLFDGILPKIDAAFAAIEKGVKEVLIGEAEALALNVTESITGTMIR